MDCDICSRGFSPRRRPLCSSCAQAILHQPRIQQATDLLDREKPHNHAEAVVRPGNDGVLASLPEDADFDAITGGIKKHSTERTYAEIQSIKHRVDHILDKAQELKMQIEEYKAIFTAQKHEMERRRDELAAERRELEKYKPRTLDPLLSTCKKTSQKLVKVRHRITEARLLLCREAAAASNLQRRKGAHGRSEYTLGGLVIPNLRELNVKTQAPSKPVTIGNRTVDEPHELVSEAVDSVARLVSISAYYLSVRLPAEMILPHEDFPRAVVMPEKASYKLKSIHFPGRSASQSSSPAASRVLEASLPRPRHLWLNGPLSQLYKDDPKSFAMYVEGVMLLGWNLAWLCKTQGMNNINTFEDVCAFDRNLWQLLMTQHRKLHRPSADQKVTSTTSKGDLTKESHVGLFSHNSVKNNLVSAEGMDLLRDWKLITGTRLIDKLKSYLITEIAGAEWEVLDEQEWEEDREDEKPVLVGGSRRSQESKHTAMSIMTVAPHDGTVDEPVSTLEANRKRSSGWMKVRGRPGVLDELTTP